MNESYDESPQSHIEQLRRLGLEVEQGRTYTEFSRQLDTEKFTDLRPSAIRSLSKAYDECLIFLEAPRIRDSFTDHEERRRWRSSIDPELNDFYKNNKLRLNVVSSLFNKLNLVREWLRLSNSANVEAQNLTRIIDLLPKEIQEWSNLSTDQKDVVLDQLDEICIQFLKTLQST